VPPSQVEIAVAGGRETVSLTVPPRADRGLTAASRDMLDGLGRGRPRPP
jgi:hypothetical protein